MLERADRVQETTTTTGTGTVSLAGAVTGFQTFASGVSDGATIRYAIETVDKTEWEVGEGVFTDATPDTLSRVTVYASSNSGSLVDFSAGTKTVRLSLVADDIKKTVIVVGTTNDCDYICDGTADDVQIQAAIDALSSGGTILVKEGTYDITATIILDDGILLKGCGKSTIFKLASGVNEDVFSGTSKANINLSDFKIDGNQDNNPTGDNGVNLLRCNNFIIHNIWTTECKLKGINASGGYNGIVAYCRSNANTSNGITFATAGGASGDECYGMLAIGNIIYDCGGSGGLCVITPTAGYLAPTNIRLIGNRVYGIAGGVNCIDCKGGEGIIISGNDIAGGQNGIDLGSTGFTSEGVIVTGNTIKNAAGYGIGLALATNCLVTGNRIYDDQDTPTMDYAVYESAGSDNNTIEGNDVTDGHTATVGIVVVGSDTIVRNNTGFTNLANFVDFNPQEGFLLNGKIVPSVTSDNLTVAIKGVDGENPSLTNPVYCRIGDTTHKITSALSVTKNAGTNWFNAGSSELATKEIDYFVYLGYNATDGVVIGFSRIPTANSYDDFSATTTNEQYCAISTITNASATDYYELIGRFASTLSAGAGYTWTVPTFTAKNLIQKPIYETRTLNWTPTFTGFSSDPATPISEYTIKGQEVKLRMRQANNGTSNDTTFTMSLPILPKTLTCMVWNGYGQVSDNGSKKTTAGEIVINNGASAISIYTDFANGAFTNSGNKRLGEGSITYDII